MMNEMLVRSSFDATGKDYPSQLKDWVTSSNLSPSWRFELLPKALFSMTFTERAGKIDPLFHIRSGDGKGVN